jgi:putative ABC transport system permease protein
LIFAGEEVEMPVGGFLSLADFPLESPSALGGERLAPTVLVANARLTEYVDRQALQRAYLFTDRADDMRVLREMHERVAFSRSIRVQSRVELHESMVAMRQLIGLLGSSLSFIVGLSAVLNFVNSISVGVLVRKRELATMESLGMTPRQLKHMLVDEGLAYGVVALGLIGFLGNFAAFGLFQRVAQLPGLTMMVFVYPIIPAVFAVLMVLGVCAVVPRLAYRTVGRNSIVDRLKEGE